MNLEKCIFCENKAEFQNDYRRHIYEFKCSICGSYQIDRAFYDDFPPIARINDKRLSEYAHLFSGYIRSLNLTEKTDFLISNENYMFILSQAPKTVRERVDHLILNLSKMTKFPGEKLFLHYDFDYTLGYCSNSDEFQYYLKHLTDAGYINGSTIPQSDGNKFTLTVKGWERVYELQQTHKDSSQVFVAMNFDKEFNDCYDKAIKTAIEETGYKPYRIDKVEHNDKIDDKILAEIKRSKFIIAEFTGQKHGVYFEAGYAMGLGRPVIWTCQKKDVDENKLHFDTRQFNHIVWETNEELSESLINRIRVVVGDNSKTSY